MKFTQDEIRRMFPSHILARGRAYFLEDRVEILEIAANSVSAFVYGTYRYEVEIAEDRNGNIELYCSCPYWGFCKHAAAVMLSVESQNGKNIVKERTLKWQTYLSKITRETFYENYTRNQYKLIYQLAFERNCWLLSARKAQLRKDGSLSRTYNISGNDFFLYDIEMTQNDKLAISFLEKYKYRNDVRYYYNYRTNAIPFKYNDAVGSLFDILRNSLIFLTDDKHKMNPIQFDSRKANIEFRLVENGEKLKLQPFIRLDNSEQCIDQSFKVLTSEPVWLFHKNTFIQVENMNDATSLIPFTLSNHKVYIPHEDLGEFISAVAKQLDLFENMKLPDGIKTSYTTEIKEKRIYIEEMHDECFIHLKFNYGGVEVDARNLQDEVWQKSDQNIFIKVIRNQVKEKEAEQVLRNSGLMRYGPGVFRLHSSKALDWLIDEVPKLVDAGFVIYGEENMKKFRVNRSPAQIRVSVESDIDWFDLNMEIDFGGILLSLKELRKSLQKKERYVKLADGSTARLPKEWINQFRHAVNFSEEGEQDRLRFSHFHVTLIDELFANAQQKTFDQTYYDSLKRLNDFTGIKEIAAPENFQGTLRSYQEAGFQWLNFLNEFRFGGCLADDMGLGKTIQAITILLHAKTNGNNKPSLIVAPTSIVFNWIKETERFAPEIRVLNQTGINRARSTRKFGDYDVILTSYGTLRHDVQFIKDYQFSYVILDESQNIKNPITQTAKAVRILNADHRLALTGTPVENNTLELWSLFAFLNPGLLGNLNYFKREFAKPIEQNHNSNTANLLKKMIFPFILRRKKEDVEKDLPPKVENTVYAEMSSQQEKLYNHWRNYFRAALLKQIDEVGLDKSRMNVLEGLTKLRQIACHPILVEKAFHHKVGKYDLFLEYLKEILSEGHKILVFSQFVKMLAVMRRYLDSTRIKYEYLDGRTRNRKKCVERFQNEDACKLFLISLRAGGTGLNLTAADYVFHYDPWWNPAVEAQATDRAHRIGQDKNVFVYRMITKNTVEEKILQLQERKKNLVNNLITTEAGLFKQLTIEDINGLFS